MKTVDYIGNCHYEVTGEREAEAAAALEEALSGVAKRRNAYVQSEIDLIIKDICEDYSVEITMGV